MTDEDLDYTIDLVLAELEAHRQRFDRDEQRIETLEAQQRPSLGPDDRAHAERIAPVLVAAFGSSLFTTRDAWRRRAAAPGLALVLDGWTPDRLGRLLGHVAAAGQAIAGGPGQPDLLVESLEREGHARIWKIRGVLELASSTTPFPATRRVRRMAR